VGRESSLVKEQRSNHCATQPTIAGVTERDGELVICGVLKPVGRLLRWLSRYYLARRRLFTCAAYSAFPVTHHDSDRQSGSHVIMSVSHAGVSATPAAERSSINLRSSAAAT